ncbi:hypothetical protein [Ponticoccus alexandrii]|nr:hypothetical protein [Ponticoccus alexandrii]
MTLRTARALPSSPDANFDHNRRAGQGFAPVRAGGDCPAQLSIG